MTRLERALLLNQRAIMQALVSGNHKPLLARRIAATDELFDATPQKRRKPQQPIRDSVGGGAFMNDVGKQEGWK